MPALVASRRRLLVRHLLAGGARHPPAARRGSAGRTADPSRAGDRPLAVGVPPRHLHQRDSPGHASVRRLLRPQPRQQRGRALGGSDSRAMRRIRFRPARAFAPTSTCRCSICRPKATWWRCGRTSRDRTRVRAIGGGSLPGAAHAETPRWVVEEPPPLDRGQGCRTPVNAAPHHAFVKAGLRALTRWVRDGVAPPQSPAIELGDPAAADPIVRDSFGNAKGGVRLPRGRGADRDHRRPLATTSPRRSPARRTSASCSARPCPSIARRSPRSIRRTRRS